MTDQLVVGFDLDMTLIDTRAGFAATLDALGEELGVRFPTEELTRRLGPPLDHLLRDHLSEDAIGPAGDRFRAIYPDTAVLPTRALAGGARRRCRRTPRARSGAAGDGQAHAQRPAARRPPRSRRRPRRGPGVGGRQGCGAARARRGDLRRRPRPRRRGCAGRRCAERLGADRRLHRGRAARGRHRRRAGRPHRASRPGSRSTSSTSGWRASRRTSGRRDALLVAFSGGADSAFLLAAAVRALGPDRVAAATAYSDSLPMSERQPALDFAAGLGVTTYTPQTDEMAREGYRANAGDRCAFCKSELLDVLGPLAAAHGYDAVATGTNADDARAGLPTRDPRRGRAWRGDPAARRRADQGPGPGRLAGLGPADLGQAGGRLPELADRLRHRDHPVAAGARRAGRGRRPRRPSAGPRRAGARPRRPGPGRGRPRPGRSTSTSRCWPTYALPASTAPRSIRSASAPVR